MEEAVGGWGGLAGGFWIFGFFGGMVGEGGGKGEGEGNIRECEDG